MKNPLILLFLICFVGRLFSQPNIVSDSSVSFVTYSYGDNNVLINSATHFYVKNIGESGEIKVTVTIGSYTENETFTVQENTKYEFISVFATKPVVTTQSLNISASFQDSSGLKLTYTNLSTSNVPIGPTSSRLVFRSGVENDWTSINNFAQTSITGLAASGTNIFAGFAGDGVFLSTNGGVSWTAVNNGIWSRFISCITVGGTNLFAGTNGNVSRSTNNGTNWMQSSKSYSGLTSDIVLSLAILDTNLFAGSQDNGIFLSTNSGTNWTTADSGLPNTSYVAINALAVSGTNLFAGTVASGIFLSTNNGTSWTAVNSGLTNAYVLALAVSGTNLFAGTDGGVFLSTNNGTSWTVVNSGLTYTDITLETHAYIVYAFAVSGNNLFAGTNGGIFLSTNNGTSWTQVNAGLSNTIVHTLAISGTDIFAGTGDGNVWRRQISDMITAVKDNQNNIPMRFSLSQNYPNPFNPSTTISFSIPLRSSVSLKVLDLLGREVATIVSGEMQAGNYTRQWNATKMSSGIYFYRLQAGSYIQTKKLILLK